MALVPLLKDAMEKWKLSMLNNFSITETIVALCRNFDARIVKQEEREDGKSEWVGGEGQKSVGWGEAEEIDKKECKFEKYE